MDGIFNIRMADGRRACLYHTTGGVWRLQRTTSGYDTYRKVGAWTDPVTVSPTLGLRLYRRWRRLTEAGRNIF